MSSAGPTTTRLTPREAEVLTLVRQRLTNAEIADRLFVSVRTVETHVSALLRKLGAADRRALAARLDVADAAPGDRAMLPASLTPFVGRVEELATLVASVTAHRLVCATGPGGVGKTRLALAAAQHLGDEHGIEVVFVDLVKATEPDMVVAAVADAVGVPELDPGRRIETLIAALADRACLLLIDNCEHVQDAARVCVERLLEGCPDVRVLATSRVRLMLPYEHVVAVPGLSLDSIDGRSSDAVTLFVERMAAAGAAAPASEQEWANVRAICARLDGLALALELAAGRVPGFGLDGLGLAIGERLDVLSVGTRSVGRHRSLSAAIAWSYDLLDDDERSVLLGAAVFSAPFDLEAISAVVDRPPATVLGTLARLVDWNLVSLRPGWPSRYRVLETIRQYALELPGAGLEMLRTAHLDWCERTIDRFVATAPGDERWCAEVDAVLDDARAALAWVVDEGPDQRAGPFARHLADALFQRGHAGESQRRYEEAATWTTAATERVHLLRVAAGAAAARNVGVDAVALLTSAATIAESAELFDDAAHALACAAALQRRAPGIMDRPVAAGLVDATLDRAKQVSRGGDRAVAAIAVADGWTIAATARSFADTAHALELARAAGEPLLVDEALDQRLALEINTDDLGAAAITVEQRLDALAPVPLDALSGFEHYDARHMGCHTNLGAGRLNVARRYADAVAALPFFREQRHIGLGRRMMVDAIAGHFESVVADAELFEADWRLAGRPVAGNLAIGAYAAAMVHGILGDVDRRARWVGITGDLMTDRTRLLAPDSIWPAVLDALLALHDGDLTAATLRLAADPEDIRVSRSSLDHQWLPWYAALWAETCALDGGPDLTGRLARAATISNANPIAASIVERAQRLAEPGRSGLDDLAERFAALDCPYQAARTRSLATRPAI